VRDNFFAPRKFVGLDDLNVQAEAWCTGLAGKMGSASARLARYWCFP
jgi:hypothetical protein